GLYSQLHQFRISTGGDIFTKKEKYYLNGWYYNSYLPELYFGTGNNVSPQYNSFIDYRVWYMNTNVLRNIYKKWFTGITYTFERVYNMNLQNNERAIADAVKVAGLQNYTISGAGFRVRHDSRDNILSSRKGLFVDMYFNSFRTKFGSNYNFEQFGLDARKFINLTPKKYNIVCANLIAEQASGIVPFRYLSNITARGYHPNLYRDNSLLSLQAEYRFRIWRWFGASMFAGGSEVAPSFNKMNLQNIRENYGGGFRFRLLNKNNMYLRVEYGQGHHTSYYYVAFTDAF
ncbi:MAG TPA: hypothetical protein VK766_05640, partial [Cytophagaceae bacterium]|nr:hypothetical protein [Cytophagaceae bacterium]